MEFNKISRPELLAPAQDWNTLKVVRGLTDAIYFGVENYNMRAKAKNFKQKELFEISEYCHNSKPRMNAYLCTNILIYDSELQDLENLISEAKDAYIDAIIVHDLAAIKIAKRYGMKFHISTQANISNIESAKFYENLGAERIVLARELSLKQIAKIKEQLKKTRLNVLSMGRCVPQFQVDAIFQPLSLNLRNFLLIEEIAYNRVEENGEYLTMRTMN